MTSQTSKSDYGTGEKKLSVYLKGMLACILLTLISFGIVLLDTLPKWQIILLIFASACIQFFVQVIFFLRLNMQTTQGKMNVMAFLFTGAILVCIIFGSLWIMWNLNYYMAH